jgi:[ribosomal protein S18]-alanine N-acetyltransferase
MKLAELLRQIEGPDARWSLKDFEEELAHPDSRIFKLPIDDSDEILAFLLYRIYPDGLEIMNLAVQHRGRGWGTRLMQEFLTEIESDPALLELEEIRLEVAARNLPAIKLYQKAGFIEVARRAGYYKDGDDALLMKLPLTVMPEK